MTSPSSTRTGAPTPGDRPHLPPVPTTSRRTDRKTPMGWLPWLLLGLLLLTLLIAALLMKVAADDTASSTAASQSGAQSQDATAETDAAQGTTDAAAEGTTGAAGTDAALTAGGRDLLALPGGDVGAVVGDPAQGAAQVQSVVADEGFWVGPSAANRVFVFLTSEARRSAGESGFQVQEGQTVRLTGSVKASSAEFAERVGLTDAEGADLLVRQGGYVEATEVQLAG